MLAALVIFVGFGPMRRSAAAAAASGSSVWVIRAHLIKSTQHSAPGVRHGSPSPVGQTDRALCSLLDQCIRRKVAADSKSGAPASALGFTIADGITLM